MIGRGCSLGVDLCLDVARPGVKGFVGDRVGCGLGLATLVVSLPKRLAPVRVRGKVPVTLGEIVRGGIERWEVGHLGKLLGDSMCV